MSYQVLARKWRPQHFGQLVGQDHVKTALTNALNHNRLHHAYLFTGTRGVGKTTIARIFAKSLNCETGVTSTPCGVCSACVEIDQGFFVDLLEIDAASRTKVEDTRDLLDNVQYAPSRGRYKVYLIDEVHMLSRHSFNALLKTLEEPPPHVKFLLATTDPQKLPVTVLSRCLQFSLKALSPEQIKQHLSYVLAQEGIPAAEDALALLARAAKGSLRDSLSLTDQAIAQSNSNITVPLVRDMLGYLEQQWAELLLAAVINRDLAALKQHLDQLVQQHSHFAHVLDDMLALLHLAALSQFNWQAADLVTDHSAFVQQLAEQQSPEQLQLFYQLLISGKKELAFAPEPRIGLEMALLRAVAFVPGAADATPAMRASLPVSHAAELKAKFNLPETTPAPIPTKEPELVPQMAESLPSESEITVEISSEQHVATEVVADVAQPVAAGIAASILARRGIKADAVSADRAVETQSEKKSEPTPAVAKAAEPAAIPKAPPLAVLAPETQPLVTQLAVAPVQTQVQPIEQAEPVLSVYPDESDALDIATEDADFAADWAWQEFQQQHQSEPEPESQPMTGAPEAKAQYRFDGVITAENFSVRLAAQVDEWAALVDSLNLGGLLRLYLLHSCISWAGDTVQLLVCQSQQHLDKEKFRAEIIKELSQAFHKAVQLDIQYQPWVETCPVAIQQRIEQERLVYVEQLLQNDPWVVQLQKEFGAEIVADSIIVN
ncbi:DNA polymerase III subunit gamma/tau [Rheinheimera soli]|uniref:DNA polymerase III subunit gamma/tau n=1 Tax=Rheinheimera soli TaxID=443616 RepID=A0ABU1W5C2_9GAMM|nr:DNA polymerase III subunit gamma/tau [Rheinheimera soli]MDR7123149.1 DNA polymerase-3 subunit gamma/tau [Rheinheimera soli]